MGQKLYEAMLVWGDPEEAPSGPDELEFARIWNAIPKVVFSTTLEQAKATPGWPATTWPTRWLGSGKRRGRA